MEVSGYPHYENVASNVLAFYFQPKEEHGLGDLMLSAFVAAAGKGQFGGAESAVVRREKSTKAGGRLDLLIDAGGFVIGIENKIFHSPNNDFADYRDLIECTGSPESVRIRAVLSPKPIRNHESMTSAQFVSVTYTQLWDCVRERIGRYVQTAHPKWLNYLFDFMETTTRMAGENNGLTATDEFLISHYDLIEQLLRDRQALLSRLGRNVGVLKDMMDEESTMMAHLSQRRIWESTCLVHDFEDQGRQVALDLKVSFQDWSLTFFNRPSTPKSYLDTLTSQPSLRNRVRESPLEAGHHLVAKWPLQTPLEELQRDLTAWVMAVSEAIDSSLP
jgi:hypothetical protein